jgi:hypothetical protein
VSWSDGPVWHSRKRHGAWPNIGESYHCIANTFATRAYDAIQPDDFAPVDRHVNTSAIAGRQAGYSQNLFADRSPPAVANF